VCQELADQTIGLKEIVQARTQRRKQVRDDLKERTTLVDQLLTNHRTATPAIAPTAATAPDRPRLKRYINE